MSARPVDLRDHLRHRYTFGVCDFLQAAPECVFEADASLVSINLDGAFDDCGFHEHVPNICSARNLANFDALHSRVNDGRATAVAFVVFFN